MAKKRRRWLRALSWAALFLSAAAVGVWVAAELGPERLRREAELALSEVLGEAQVGSVSLGWSTGPSITARGIRVLDEGEVALALEDAELRLDLLRLFRSGGRFDRLRLQGLVLHLRRLPDGTLKPARVGQWLSTERSGGAGPAENPLVKAGLREIEILDAVLRFTAESRSHPTATLLLEEFALHLELGEVSRLDATARAGTGAIRVRAAGKLDAPQFNATLENADLSSFDLWLRRLTPEFPALRGLVDASVRGRRRDGELEIDLFSVRLSDGTVDDIRLPSFRASGRAGLHRNQVSVSDLEVVVDEIVVRGEAEVPRPFRGDAPLRGSLRAQRLPFDTLGDYAEDFGLRAVAEQLALLQNGSFDAVNLSAEGLRGDGLRDWLANPMDWPIGLRLEAAFRSKEIALEDGEPLRELAGQATIDTERLVLSDVRAKLGDRPLPTMTLAVDDWSRLVGAKGQTHIAAVPPIVGRPALIEWATSKKRPEPAWQRAHLELDWLDHPALLGPLDRVTATLRPLAPGIEVVLHRARWAGVWVSGSGRLSGGPNDGRIILNVKTHTLPPTQIGDPVATTKGGQAKRDGVHWASGRTVVDVKRVGPFTARQVSAPLRAIGARLLSDQVVLLAEPRGHLSGTLELNLSVEDRVPYKAAFQLSDGDLATLLSDLGLPGPPTEGSVVLGADFEGHLRVGEPMVASMRGPLSAHARDGVVYRRIPWAFAIAAASDTFNPFRSRDSLPYKAIDGNFNFDAGRVEAESFTITGPTLRLVATGHVALESPYTMEAVAGLFFFRGLDKVIGGVPILSTLLLGSDENLVPAYFSLEGPWSEPKARLIPIKTFFSGPASIVTEGVPNFVFGGLSRLGRLFTLKPSRTAKPKAPEATP